MKKFLSIAFVLFAFVALQAQNQTVIFNENFDNYNSGQSLLSQNNNDWTTWSGGQEAESGTIVSSPAQSAPNSLFITGSSDMIHKMGGITSGHYLIDFDYYIPVSGNGGYFNILHNFAGGSSTWAFECYMGPYSLVKNEGGLADEDLVYAGLFSYDDTSAVFFYTPDTWFHINLDIDLDKDNITANVAGEEIASWQFSTIPDTTNNTMMKMDAINFFAGCLDNSMTENSTLSGTYYVDNLVIAKVNNVGIEENSNNSITVYPNPANSIINVNNSENAQITVFDISGRVMATIEKASENQTISVENFANGTYFLRIADGNSVVTKKFMVVK